MTIFDEPSRKPLPQPTFEDAIHAGRKGFLSMIPFIGSAGAELIDLLSTPLGDRRDEWLADLERRLHDLEENVEGFRFDDLAKNEQFVTVALQATQAALRTHQAEKHELRNTVLNVALARNDLPGEDQQVVFLNFIDGFTPVHLRLLGYIYNRANSPKPTVESDLSNQVVQDLDNRGLLKDGRPYAARGRYYDDLLSCPWDVSLLGKQFLEFIKAPATGKE